MSTFNFNTIFPKERVFVLSLSHRTDRQNHIKKELAKFNIEYNWHLVEKHPKSGTIGCLESHVSLIQKAKENNWESIFIFEDDCLWTDIVYEMDKFPTPPKNWDMMYYGGVVNEILEDYNENWKRVSTWYTHAYAIKDSMYDRILHLADIYKGKKSIDEIYCDSIHPNHNCYMSTPIIATQMEDYSDIEGHVIDRDVKVEYFDLTVKKMNPNPKWAYRTYLLGGNSVNTMTYYYDYHLKIGILEDIELERIENLMKGNHDRDIEFSVFIKADNDKDIEFYMAKIHSNEITMTPCKDDGIFFYSLNQKNDDILFNDLGIYIINNFSYLINKKQNVSKTIKLTNQVDNEFKSIRNISDDELPKISIVTPSMGRKNIFRIAYNNWLNFDYPKDKMEWVVINEGDESYYSMLKNDKRITYVHIYPEQVKEIYNQYCIKLVPSITDQKTKPKHLKYKLSKKLEKVHLDGHFFKNRIPIGMKRNMGIKATKNDIIIFMDDDDYYPPESLKTRVMDLVWGGDDIKCVACSDIACYDIQYQVSFMNSPPSNLPIEKQVSEASMCFYKSFWEEKQFKHQDIGSEGESFLRGRVDNLKMIPWLRVIVALHHRENTANRDTKVKDSNGWHFGEISDEVSSLIRSIDSKQIQEIEGNK